MSLMLCEPQLKIPGDPPPPPDHPDEGPSSRYYTPGHRGRKLLMVLAGLLLMGVGFWQMLPSLRLLLMGVPASAEAVSVIKTKRGVPELVLATNQAVQAATEMRDREYVFTNRFQFLTRDGVPTTVDLQTRSQLKPLFPLTNNAALPVRYDPHDAGRVVFPTVAGTWFIPAMLTTLGGVCACIGLVLWWRANEPIEMPFLLESTTSVGTDPNEPVGT